MKSVRTSFAVAATLLLLVSGCGGEDTSKSADAIKDKGQQISGAPSDVDLGDLEGLADGVLGEECRFLFNLALAPGLVAAGQLDVETLEGIDAPPELADDVKVFLAALTTYVKDPAKNASALSSEEFATASQHISDYVDENCKDFGN